MPYYYQQEMCKFAIDNGIIDVASIQILMKENERKQYLAIHPFKIWQGKNALWYTYLPDEKKGRVQRQRTNQKAIEDLVISYWKEHEKRPTFEAVFKEWNERKLTLEKISKATYTRNISTYNRFFTDFGKNAIDSIEGEELLEWLEQQVPKYQLTAKAFCGLKALVRGVFKYARRKNWTKLDIEALLRQEDLSDLSFRKRKKEDNEEVFDEAETCEIMKYLSENIDSTNLCILLMFITGMRVGEATTLKNDDIGDGFVNVRRTQTTYYNENGKRICDVKDFPKTAAGWRTIVIPKQYQWVLDRIKLLNPFGEYIFVGQKKQRINVSSVRTRLNTITGKLGIAHKSPHKIRKTYGSILLDNNLDREFVKTQMGHSQISMTENVYHRNRRDIEKKQNMISQIPDFAVSQVGT